jgi:photosystem II stability/assembly factor-like uncharacterized protein
VQKSTYAYSPPGTRSIALSFLISCLIVPNILGADGIWQSCGHIGTVIDAMAVDPATPNVLYIATNYGIFRSTNSGANWTSKNGGIPRNAIFSVLVIHPRNPAIIYAGSNLGVFKSSNSGESWSNVGLSGTNVVVVAIDPQSPTNIYAGTHDGVFKSTDGGGTWNEVINGLPIPAILDLAIDPSASAILYAGNAYGVWKSTNGGETWDWIGLADSIVVTVKVNPQNSAVLYAVTWSEGMYRSSDGGAHWQSVNNGLTSMAIYDLVIDPGEPTIVYAATRDGIFKSTNGGETWSKANNGIPDPVRHMAIDPQSSATVYAASDLDVFRSNDRGMNWIILNNGLAASYIQGLAIHPQNPIVYAATENRAFKSTDRGANWSAVNKGLNQYAAILSLALDPQNPETVYAGANGGGVYKSIDGGANWNAANNGLADSAIDILAIDPQSPETLYAAGHQSGVYKSTNGGASWSRINSGFATQSITALAINPLEPAILYAGALQNGVYKSTNGGGSWTQASSGLNATTILALVLNPLDPDILYAGDYGNGVFKSTDGGASWIPVNAGLSEQYVTSLAINPSNTDTVYAGTYGGLVFRSTDGGATWASLSMGLPGNINIEMLAVDPTDPRNIYAGTNGRGLWAYKPSASSISFTLNPGGAAGWMTSGNNISTLAGYATLTVSSGDIPYGTAVFSFKHNGITVAEAGVMAFPPTTRARIFIDYRENINAVPGRAGAGLIDVNTGIAIVNRSPQTAGVAYTLRTTNGEAITTGNGSIPAGHHFAKFIDQFNEIAAGFDLPADFSIKTQFASLEISSDQPLSILALRMTINQRNDMLLTTTPVADLEQSLSTESIYFPHFVDGGGYTSSLILLNTSGATENGSLQILDNRGIPLVVNQVGGTAGSSFSYSIPSGGAFVLRTDGFPATPNSGWVRLIPDPGASTPIASGIFSYNPADVLVSESGVPTSDPTTHARIYVDLSGNHNTGIALANVEDAAATITIRAFQKDGITQVGSGQEVVELSANGHDAYFADRLIPGLPQGFTGVLDINSKSRFAALTLRSLNNENNDFLMTAFPIADLNRPAPSPIVFPHIADGGGYSTEFILLSPAASSSAVLHLFGEISAPLDSGN